MIRMPKMESLSQFETKISPHLASAYNLARWLTRNDVDAEDVLQDSLIRAFRFFSAVQNEDVRPWFLQIVRNTSFSWIKKNGNFVELTDVILEKNSTETNTAETRLLQALSVEEIRSALDQLAPEFREILVLREFEDLSYAEISQVVGLKQGTVMSRLSRAREKLTSCLVENRKGEKS